MAETYERAWGRLSPTQARLLRRIAATERLIVGAHLGARRNTYRALVRFGLAVPGDFGDVAELTRRGRVVERVGDAS